MVIFCRHAPGSRGIQTAKSALLCRTALSWMSQRLRNNLKFSWRTNSKRNGGSSRYNLNLMTSQQKGVHSWQSPHNQLFILRIKQNSFRSTQHQESQAVLCTLASPLESATEPWSAEWQPEMKPTAWPCANRKQSATGTAFSWTIKSASWWRIVLTWTPPALPASLD